METAVNKLFEAYRSNSPIELNQFDFKTKEEAYNVQDMVLDLKKSELNEYLAGYKISLTSKTTQDMFKCDSPLYGGMTNVTIKDKVLLSDYNEPLLELELVFLVDEDIEIDDTNDMIMKKCRVAPGIEVPDGRYKNWFPNTNLYEILADGAVNGAVVIGEPQKVSYDDIDGIKGSLIFNGKFVKEGKSSEVLDHPVNSVKWLAKILNEQGKKLSKGLFISTGTFVLPERLQTGSYEAIYENLGSVKLEVI